MELTIILPEDVEQALERRAKASGQDVKTLVETVLKATIAAPSEFRREGFGGRENLASASTADADFEADMLTFAEGPDHLSPYSGTYSRVDIYFDHD